jgi:hypothetical protein
MQKSFSGTGAFRVRFSRAAKPSFLRIGGFVRSSGRFAHGAGRFSAFTAPSGASIRGFKHRGVVLSGKTVPFLPPDVRPAALKDIPSIPFIRKYAPSVRTITSFVRTITSFVRTITSFVRTITSFVRTITSFVRTITP